MAMHGLRGLAELAMRIAALEQRANNGMLRGVVHDVDPAQGLVRLNLGAGNDGDFVSPWIPYAQTGGQIRLHNPPSAGQLMVLFAPSGEITQGIAMPLGFTDANPSPSGAGAEAQMEFGDLTVVLNGSGVTISAGGVSVAITGAGLAVTGGAVTHNGVNTGDTHVHGGVVAGGADTAVPH